MTDNQLVSIIFSILSIISAYFGNIFAAVILVSISLLLVVADGNTDE